jgi:hypothetical protein
MLQRSMKKVLNKKGLKVEFKYNCFALFVHLFPFVSVKQLVTSAAKQQAPQPPMHIQLSSKMYSSDTSNC